MTMSVDLVNWSIELKPLLCQKSLAKTLHSLWRKITNNIGDRSDTLGQVKNNRTEKNGWSSHRNLRPALLHLPLDVLFPKEVVARAPFLVHRAAKVPTITNKNTGLQKSKCVNIQNYSYGNHLWTKWKRMVKLKAMPRCLLTIFTEFLLILGLYLDFETLNSTFCNSGGVNCLTSPNLCVLQPTSIPSYSVSSGGLSS